MLTSIFRIYVLLGGFFCFHVIVSAISFPYLSKDICIIDSKALEHKKEILEVLRVFNKYGIPMKLSCNDLTSIKMYFIPASDENYNTLASAFTMGIPLSTPLSFIPLLHFNGQKIRFVDLDWSNTKHFQAVLIHEIGHILGIGHVATDPNHIMYPYVRDDLDSLDRAVLQIKGKAYGWRN